MKFLIVALFWTASAFAGSPLEKLKEQFASFRESFVPGAPASSKSRALDELFTAAADACRASCREAVAYVRKLNQQSGGRPIEALLGHIPPELAQLLPTDELNKLSSVLQKLLTNLPEETVEHRISMGIEILRYLVKIEEDLLFEVQDRKISPSEALKRASTDLSLMKRQIVALYKIHEILQRRNLTGAESTLDKDKSSLSPEDWRDLAVQVNELGVFFQKILQSYSNSLFLNAKARAYLAPLRDQVQPMPPEEVLQIIREDYGMEASEIFIDFQADKPLASGTIAQAHRAFILNDRGEKVPVIVKIKRRGLQEMLRWNRHTNRIIARLAKMIFRPETGPFVDLGMSLIEGLENAIDAEQDFYVEADNLTEFRRRLRFVKGIVVPKVYRKLLRPNVLVMEEIPGNSLDPDGPAAQLSPKEKKAAFRQLLEAFLHMTLIIKKSHADLHPGNIQLVAGNKIRLGFIDFAQVVGTRGMLALPAKLSWATFTANSKSIAENLVTWQSGSKIEAQQIEPIVREVLEKFKIVPSSITRIPKLELEDLINYTAALGTIHLRLIKELGYRPNPAYLQLTRSLFPVLMSLIGLMKEIPARERSYLFLTTLSSVYLKAIPRQATSAVENFAAKGLSKVQTKIRNFFSCEQSLSTKI